jgi:hypothetical protein
MLCVKERFTIGNILRTHCQIHGDTLPNIWGHIAKCMGTDCQHKIYVQHIWGQIANTKEYIYGISLIIDCRLAHHHTKTRTSHP